MKYLSASHGLAPEEAQPIMYDAERRIHHETNIPNDHVDHACARCHNFARRCPGAVRPTTGSSWPICMPHASNFRPDAEAIAFLTKAAPLHTPEWDAWGARARTANIAGRWLVTATLLGHGVFRRLQVDNRR